jgi:hypothetical protein
MKHRGTDHQDWDGGRYAREKRYFIESRMQFRGMRTQMALIFTFTWLAGWLCSFLMLKSGITLLAGRYAVSFLVSYLVFLGAVRIWAGFMSHEPSRRGDDSAGLGDAVDIASLGSDAEGWFIGWIVVAIGLVLGLVVTSLFSMLGGLPLLLEVAFEVVFAGTVVRRMSRRETIGDWSSRLVGNTWLPALVCFVLLVGFAGWLQARAPGSRTFAEALKVLLGF